MTRFRHAHVDHRHSQSDPIPGLIPQLNLLHLFLAGVFVLIVLGLVIYWNVMKLARLLFRYTAFYTLEAMSCSFSSDCSLGHTI